MLVLFFTIIVIAELIITVWLVLGLIKADKAVCETNKKIIEFQPILKSKLGKLKSIISLVLSSLDYCVMFIAEKKENFQNAFKKNLLSSILCIILKIPGKQILTILEILLTLKKLFKKKERI